MILTAEEFARLRRSDHPAEYNRAGHEEAPLKVWLAVIDGYPDLREWVAYNKNVPLSVLERLATDPDEKVRSTVAGKRKLSAELQALLARDPDAGVRQRLRTTQSARPTYFSCWPPTLTSLYARELWRSWRSAELAFSAAIAIDLLCRRP